MKLRVSGVRNIVPDMVLVVFKSEDGAALPVFRAGQFVELNFSNVGSFLNRPFSVFYANDSEMWLLIKIVGTATRALSEARIGDKAVAIGPLGRGFTLGACRPLLVGGGVGIAPIAALARNYAAAGITPDVILGNRSQYDQFIKDSFVGIARVFLSTDDGSEGFHGLVTESDAFRPAQYDIVQTCGPTPMMKAVAAAAGRAGVRCEVSLENRMACGLGACLCCVQDTADGQRRCVCTEGPVFNSTDLVW